MISISDSHWLAGVREATGCTADQARVYLAVATMPLSSQANVAGVLQWRPRRVQTALKALMDGGLLRFYNLGCEAHLSRRYYINYGRILTLGERVLDLWAPLLHWHVPACLAYLLQRLPLLEHIYAAVADQHGIGPLEEFRWFRGTPWRAAARFRDGWVPYHWIGTPSGRGDIADTLNRTAAEIQDQRWEGEAPIPHHMVIITPDLWQEWQVTEVAGEMGILQHLQLRSVRGGIVYGPREGWPSRGWVVDPLPPPRPGPWTLDDQLAASRWRQPGGWLAARLVDCVLEWPGATSRFATAYVYRCRDEDQQKVVLGELKDLCDRRYLRSEPFDGRSRMYFIDAAGYDFATTRALAEDLEEQFRAGSGKGDEAQLVDDQQVEPGQLFLQVQQAPFVPGLHHLVDQCCCGGETHGHAPLAGGQSQPQGHVGLAGAAVANGDNVLPALDVFTACQFHHQGLVQRRDGWEVEGVQTLDRGESGGADPPLHHALVAVDELQFREPEQVLGMIHILGGALGCHLTVFPEKAGQLQLLQVVFQ